MHRFSDDLAQRRALQLYRTRRVLESPQGVEVRIGGETLLSFCSNDYLGLANDTRVIEAFRQAALDYGVGSGASHLVTGHARPHHALEEELAEFVGAERALLFSTGYMANLGIAGALLGRRATVFEDRLNHASLIDAARQGNARVRRYAHGDVAQLAARLAAAEGDKLILTDGVFSMDGDLAPLPQLLGLARSHHARLLVDDAHGLGVLGTHGRGSFEYFDVPLAPPAILMGTLGKAFGSFGAFVAGEQDLIEFLIQEARTYIYTTALPPAVAEATRTSLGIVRSEPWRRTMLDDRIAQLRDGAAQLGLRLLDSPTPIQPLVLGSAAAALAASEQLRAHGILVAAIRPPTVPEGSARLRITLSALHSREQVERLLAALAALPRAPEAA
jgi:8-amino-7-oxononanoate synthase